MGGCGTPFQKLAVQPFSPPLQVERDRHWASQKENGAKGGYPMCIEHVEAPTKSLQWCNKNTPTSLPAKGLDVCALDLPTKNTSCWHPTILLIRVFFTPLYQA